MPYTPGSVARRVLFALVLSVAAVPAASAQEPRPKPDVPASPAFMAGFDFHLSAVGLVSADPHYTWDTHWGGDVDLVDYVVGRAQVLVDYEAMLGSEYRPFDPNQGNYTLEASGSARVHGTEIAGVFHHVSRHLADRPKTFAIAWNVLGVRALRRVSAGTTTIDLRVDAGKVVQHAFVDYTWAGSGDVRVDRPVYGQVGVFGRVSGSAFGVNAESGRGTQTGGLVEAGLRLGGIRRRARALRRLREAHRRRSDRARAGTLGVRGLPAGESVSYAISSTR